MSEKPFMDHLMICACRIPGVIVWRQNVGTIAFVDPATGLRRAFRSGLPKGAADLAGLHGPTGRCLQLETKAPGKKQNADQQRWETMITQHGGLYLLAVQHGELDAEHSAVRWAQELDRRLRELT
jgi:hypothetical protein